MLANHKYNMAIHGGRSLSHEVLEIYRFRAIELRKMGKQVKEIAFFFGLHPASVSRWFVNYRRRGIDSLKSRKAMGPHSKLSLEEAKNILNCLKKTATEYGFPTPLWTCERVRQLIRIQTGKEFTVVGIWKFLRRFGLTNKKPEKRALEQNTREVRRWLRKTWPEILENAREWRAIIYFQDEFGISLVPVLGKTWAPKGEIPLVRVTGRKGGFCVSSSISTGGRLLFRIEKGNVNADTFIDYLKKLISHHPNRKIIIVADKAPPHTAKKVESFLKKNRGKVILYYFPSYSPELNPDEHVGGYLKKNRIISHTAKSVKELKRLVLCSLMSMQKQDSLVKSFLYGELFNTSI